MKLDTLYKKTRTGAIQVCNIETSNDVILVTFGKLEGKMQTKTTVCYPKNVGKANETTASQQAELEAHSKHAKKIKEGYTLDPSGEISIKLPQKVKVFQDNINNLRFPAYSTAKYNGVNGTYWLQEDGSLKLTSRGGDEYPAIPHLEPIIKQYMTIFETTCLNGELYIHGEHLQDITSAVKKPKALSKRLQFIIFAAPGSMYTLPDGEKTLAPLSLIATTSNFYSLTSPSAYETIDPYIHSTLSNEFVRCTEFRKVNNLEEIEDHYNECMDNNLEGTVIYNTDAEYAFNERSSDVFKYKKTLDGEYQITGCNTDKNGHPVLICSLSDEDDKTFKVKPKGTDEERKQILADFETDYLNKWYKIEFETFSKTGIPLKPVGIGLRDCNQFGNPKE